MRVPSWLWHQHWVQGTFTNYTQENKVVFKRGRIFFFHTKTSYNSINSILCMNIPAYGCNSAVVTREWHTVTFPPLPLKSSTPCGVTPTASTKPLATLWHSCPGARELLGYSRIFKMHGLKFWPLLPMGNIFYDVSLEYSFGILRLRDRVLLPMGNISI